MYIIPANSKKGQLIFNLFTPTDLIILGTGVFISLILLLVLKGESVGEMVIKLLPVGISGVLVFPVAYYHNGRTFIKELYHYLTVTRNQKYVWRGWCSWYNGDEQEKH